MLSAGGRAFEALAFDSSNSNTSQNNQSMAAKEAFTATTTEYFTLLYEVHTKLKSQIRALEKAKIIPSTDPATSDNQNKNTIGPGTIDGGLLKTRTDTVENEMEAEIWSRAAGLVKQIQSSKAAVGDSMDTT
jgi:hypothetical protein